jgi:hypothetical protein
VRIAINTGLANRLPLVMKIGAEPRMLVNLDFPGHGAVFMEPQAIQDAAAEIEDQQGHQGQHELGWMNGNAEGPEDIDKRECLAPIDAANDVRFFRHESSSFP